MHANQQLEFAARIVAFLKADWGTVFGNNTKRHALRNRAPPWAADLYGNKIAHRWVCAVCHRYSSDQWTQWTSSPAVELMILFRKARKDAQGKRRLWYSWLCRRCWLLCTGKPDDGLTDHLPVAYIPPDAGHNK
jgi:hypothetical protein